MSGSTTSRAQTTVNVRRAMIRHWIDLDQINISPQRGYVRVSGRVRTLQRDVNTRGIASLLVILEEDIRRCKGVERVLFDLENWHKNSEGEWIEVRRGHTGSAHMSGSLGTAVHVLEESEVLGVDGLLPLPPPPEWHCEE